MGAYKTDRETGEEGFTLAGLLMFGNGHAIQDTLPHYFVDYREKLSTDPRIRYTNRIYPDGTWEPNLFQFFKRVYRELAQVLPIPFKLDGTDRVDETPAHESLREAICNTLIHSQYRMLEGIVIERYPNRLYFSNPGTMLISVETFYEGGHSICRNSILQKMFIAIGRGEHLGSGADVIGKGWNVNGWPAPEIHECFGSNTDRVELVLRLGNNTPFNARNERENERENERNNWSQLTPRQVLMLSIMKENERVTTKELKERLRTSISTVNREIATLKEADVLSREGGDNGGRWLVLINTPSHN